jgi:hypothetical protein
MAIAGVRDKVMSESRGHSEFQIEHFIINAQPTPYGRYRQCAAELRVRIRAVECAEKRRDEVLMRVSTNADALREAAEIDILIEDLGREIYILKRLFDKIERDVNLDKRDELEAEYWNKKFEMELIAHWIGGTPIPPSIVQNVMLLPNGSSAKIRLMSFMDKRARAIGDKKALEGGGVGETTEKHQDDVEC